MEWIPARERLPEREGVYLIFAMSGDPKKPLCMTVYFDPDEGRGWGLVPVWASAVSHWMPLPSPPVTAT